MTTHITKTWFDGEKVVTQEIPESGVYKQEPVAWPALTADEREALESFHETWEDDQGYDVSKPMMKRLAKLGVVYSEGFGRYGMTNFGLAALKATPPAAQRQPLTDQAVAAVYKKMAQESRTSAFTSENWFHAGVAVAEVAYGITGAKT